MFAPFFRAGHCYGKVLASFFSIFFLCGCQSFLGLIISQEQLLHHSLFTETTAQNASLTVLLHYYFVGT